MDKIKAAHERYPDGSNFCAINRNAFIYGWDAAISTHPLQAKITELLEDKQGLREALAGVIKSWDSRSHEREEKKNTHGFDYWSPVASLVDSSAIAAAREALEIYK